MVPVQHTDSKLFLIVLDEEKYFLLVRETHSFWKEICLFLRGGTYCFSFVCCSLFPYIGEGAYYIFLS